VEKELELGKEAGCAANRGVNRYLPTYCIRVFDQVTPLKAIALKRQLPSELHAKDYLYDTFVPVFSKNAGCAKSATCGVRHVAQGVASLNI